MTFHAQLAAWLSLTSLASGLPSPSQTQLLEEGSPVIGVGRLETIQRSLVLDNGTWFAQVGTDYPTSTQDGVALRLGFPILREGDPLPSPSGARVRTFGGWNVDGGGNLFWEIELTGPGIINGNRQALYWNTRLLARQAGPTGLPEFPGSSWSAFGARLPGPDGRLWFTASIDDPAVPNPRSLLATTTLRADGSASPLEVLAVTGRELAGVGLVRSVVLQGTSATVNARGTLLWAGKRAGPVETDGFLALGLDQILVAEGDPAPVDGRRFSSFEGCEVALNDREQYAFTCHLNSSPLSPEEIASNYLLVKDGAKFVQEGDSLPALGAPLDNQPETPLLLSNSGDLYWAARLRNTPMGLDGAYMRNHDVLIRKGQTYIGGQLVVELDRSIDAFAISPSGRFFLGKVELRDTGNALVMVDHGATIPIPGCGAGAAVLDVVGGSAVAGSSLRMAMDDAQSIGAHTLFCVTKDARLDSRGCGLRTPQGELFLSSPIVALLAGPLWILGPTLFDVPIPAELGLVDSVWHGQGFFLAPPNAPMGTAAWKPTNGLRIEVGAP